MDHIVIIHIDSTVTASCISLHFIAYPKCNLKKNGSTNFYSTRAV